MSKRKPEMTVTLNHDALVDAIEHYTQNMMGTASTVSNVSFTAGRGDKGYSADVTLSLGGNSQSDTVEEETPVPSGPVKRTTTKAKPGPKPKPEVVEEDTSEEEESPAPDEEEADTASAESDDDAVDPEDVPVPSSKQKRLFGSEE